jgi:hypothetical protein
VIDQIDLPATVTLGTDNMYTVAIVITYHDDDDAPAVLRLGIPSLAQSFDEPLTNAPLQGELQATVHFPATTPKGSQEIDLSLIDQSKLESLVAKQMVTLQ